MSNSNLDQTAAELGMGGKLAPEKDDAGYRKRMERRQQVQRQRVEERNKEKGLILVFTGHGKGKTTAGLGLVLRTLGHGERVAVVQFIKGGWEPGEARALQAFGEQISWHALGGRDSPGKPRTANVISNWSRRPGKPPWAIFVTTASSWFCWMNSTWPSSWATSSRTP